MPIFPEDLLNSIDKNGTSDWVFVVPTCFHLKVAITDFLKLNTGRKYFEFAVNMANPLFAIAESIPSFFLMFTHEPMTAQH